MVNGLLCLMFVMYRLSRNSKSKHFKQFFETGLLLNLPFYQPLQNFSLKYHLARKKILFFNIPVAIYYSTILFSSEKPTDIVITDERVH